MRRVTAWLNLRPLMAALVLIVIVAVPGYVRVEAVATDATSAAKSATAVALGLELERARTDLEACRSRAAIITIVRQLVELSASPDGGAFFTTVAGFDELPEDIRTYLAALDARLANAPDDGTSFNDRALKLLTVPDCDQEAVGP